MSAPTRINALYHGDIVDVNPFWPDADYPVSIWRGRVKAFHRRSVLVEALEKSDDPMVENEQFFDPRALTFVERP